MMVNQMHSSIYGLRLASRIALATAIAALASQTVGQPIAEHHEAIVDEDIAAAIEREFIYDDAVPFNRIDVHSEQGIVTLTGNVTNLTARLQAETLASVVKGVRSVVNRLVVEPSDRAPSEIAAALNQAFESDAATDGYEIDVSVNDAGVATLTGATDSWAERSLAETVALGVRGVTEVDNRLAVDTSSMHRGPGEIHNDVTQRLRWDARVDDSLVTVLVRDGGRILLSGTVGSLAEKQLAEQLAWVHGVTRVDASHLEVEQWARDQDLRRATRPMITDENVESALRLALSYDPRVLRAPVTVTAQGGSVWLRGTVDTLAAKSAAERDAYNTAGVDRVHNRLKVRPGTLVDPNIEQLARNALRGRGLLDDRNDVIELTVSDGRARITGDVDALVDYWQIDQVVASIRGVEELRNELTVRDRPPRLAKHWFGHFPRTVSSLAPQFIAPGDRPKPDRELYDDLAAELYWSPFVDEDQVDVDVDDGVVTLRGTVDSRLEADAAADNAYQAGARSVHNELVVASR